MSPLSLTEAHDAARVSPGVILFTASVIEDAGATLTRVYSSHNDAYPVGMSEPLEADSSWCDRLVRERLPFFVADVAAVRRDFYDSDVIESLGCGAVINAPVIHQGRTIGSFNLLDRDGAYDQGSLDAAAGLATQAVAALLAAGAS